MCLCTSSIEEEGPFSQFYLLNFYQRKEVSLFFFARKSHDPGGEAVAWLPAPGAAQCSSNMGICSCTFIGRSGDLWFPPIFMTHLLCPVWSFSSSKSPSTPPLPVQAQFKQRLPSSPPLSFELRRSLSCRNSSGPSKALSSSGGCNSMAHAGVLGIYSPSALRLSSAQNRKGLRSKKKKKKKD